jgi:hypothetical protein
MTLGDAIIAGTANEDTHSWDIETTTLWG